MQNRNNMQANGSITVYLALVLTVLLSVLLTVIEAARTNAIRFQAECVTDMALQSALAEYHREILEQYDLFLTDVSYGTSENGYGLLEAHIWNYLNENLSADEAVTFGKPKDLLGMSAEEQMCCAAPALQTKTVRSWKNWQQNTFWTGMGWTDFRI